MKYENRKEISDIFSQLDACYKKLDILNCAIKDLQKNNLRSFYIQFSLPHWSPFIEDDGYLFPIIEEFINDSIQHLETKIALLKNRLESL